MPFLGRVHTSISEVRVEATESLDRYEMIIDYHSTTKKPGAVEPHWCVFLP